MAEETIVDEVKEKLTWWQTHKSKIYGGLLVVAGLFGGNMDRAGEVVNGWLTHQPTVERLDKLEKRLEILEKSKKSVDKTD